MVQPGGSVVSSLFRMRFPTYAILLAGGYGTRFWPASRRTRPKQFLSLLPTGSGPAHKESLLQQTYRRLARLFPPSRIFVVGNAEHRQLLRQQLGRVPPGRLLLEPVGRNTAAAIGLAAEHIRASLGRRTNEAVVAVFPADHVIVNQPAFRRIVEAAWATAAADDVIVVLGIPPSEPHTGYGYIERGPSRGRRHGQPVFAVRRFTEKPTATTAARYLRSGRFYWNSGMFIWRLSTLTDLFKRHLPATQRALGGVAPWIGRRGYALRLQRLYRRLQTISVDYALIEPAAARGQLRVIPAAIGWSDLGSWSAVYEWLCKSKAGRRDDNITPALHLLLGARRNLIEINGSTTGSRLRRGKFFAAIGIEDLVVVDTTDALLVCRRDCAQDVGKVVEYLRRNRGWPWL